MLAVAWPFVCPARFADFGGAQTRSAQTVRTFFPKSAARLGHATRPGDCPNITLTASFIPSPAPSGWPWVGRSIVTRAFFKHSELVCAHQVCVRPL